MPRFSSLKNFEQVKRPRLLQHRSNLAIEFPQPDGRVFRTYIPFLQNPIITEQGTSNLIEYDLVGRAGSLFSYAGAKSRVLNVEFKINLLHLMYTASTEGLDEKFFRQFNLFYSDPEKARKAFRLRPGGEYDKKKKSLNAFTSEKEALERERMELTKDNARIAGILSRAGTTIGPTQYGELDEVSRTSFLNIQNRQFDRIDAIDKELQAIYDDLPDAEAAFDEAAEGLDDEFIDENSSLAPDIKLGKGFPHAQSQRAFYRTAIATVTGSRPQSTSILDSIASYFSDGQEDSTDVDAEGKDAKKKPPEVPLPMQRLNKLIDCLYVWINLVRATTLNNSKNTVQGAPIVRLNHGGLYNNIPCVVSNYSISMNEAAGYEAETLTPKELKINMTLKEVRTNGDFKDGQIGNGDHIAGWEAIIDNNNIDPYNGDVTEIDPQTGTNKVGNTFGKTFTG